MLREIPLSGIRVGLSSCRPDSGFRGKRRYSHRRGGGGRPVPEPKAFGDMEQTARLRLIRDRFIAVHGNCDLRWHLDSVSPETPIRDVVDRCRVWESHADPAVRGISKPMPDPIYPTYAVGDTDSDNEITRVAAVTGLKSDQNQLKKPPSIVCQWLHQI